jgi:hypothetical protein
MTDITRIICAVFCPQNDSKSVNCSSHGCTLESERAAKTNLVYKNKELTQQSIRNTGSLKQKRFSA